MYYIFTCISDIRRALVHNNDCMYIIIYYYVPTYILLQVRCKRYVICVCSETDETHNFYFDDAIALYSMNVLFLNTPICIHIHIIISEHRYVYIPV